VWGCGENFGAVPLAGEIALHIIKSSAVAKVCGLVKAHMLTEWNNRNLGRSNVRLRGSWEIPGRRRMSLSWKEHHELYCTYSLAT
jgi:hypothetical protein